MICQPFGWVFFFNGSPHPKNASSRLLARFRSGGVYRGLPKVVFGVLNIEPAAQKKRCKLPKDAADLFAWVQVSVPRELWKADFCGEKTPIYHDFATCFGSLIYVRSPGIRQRLVCLFVCLFVCVFVWVVFALGCVCLFGWLAG